MGLRVALVEVETAQLTERTNRTEMEMTSTLLTNRQIDERLISLEQEVNQQQSRSGKQQTVRLEAKINKLDDAIAIIE